MVAALMALVVSSVLRGRSKSVMKSMSSMMLGIMVALTFRRRVGELVQEHLTTLPDSDGVSVRRIKALHIGRMSVHWVGTGRDSF